MNNLTLEEAKELLIIDKYSLDVECQTQADIFDTVGENAVYALSERDEAKEFLQQEDARLDNKIRVEFEASGDKLTEPKLKQLITSHPDHKKAHADYMRLKIAADLWAQKKESFLQRASMVKRMCELYINKYYSDIEIKGNVSTEQVEADGIRRKLAEKRKARE